ncbi:MAG: NADH:ubiquinone reductase (Na(+)-transporting) subunit B [bacterium]
MKLVISLLKKQEALFAKGSKLERFYPLFEALESFLVSTKLVTKNQTHIRDAIDTKRYMIIVVLALIPCTLFGIYNAGYQAHLAAGWNLDFISVFLTGARYVVPIILVSYTIGGLWETLFAVVRKHEINEGFLVTGLLFPLTCPPNLPLWQVALGITFGVVIGKEVFGGTGRNFLNPALTARAFVFFTYPVQISGEVWTALPVAKEKLIDGYSGATALAVAAQTSIGSNVMNTLKEAGFTLYKLFFGLIPGSIGETSVFCVLLGAGLLLLTKIGSWRIMLGSLIGAIGTVLLFNLCSGPDSLPFYHIGPFWQIYMGSFAFATVFMATDPVSAPDLEESKWVYGLLIGSMGMIIRVVNPAYPEGWMLAILLMNVFAPLIDHIILQRKLKKRIPNVI